MEHFDKSGLVYVVPLKLVGSVIEMTGALPDMHITRFLPAKKDLRDFLWSLGSGQVRPQS